MITLRPVEPGDIDIFYEHQADPLVAQMAVFEPRDPAAHLEHWTKRVLANPDNITRTVVVDGAVAGSIGSWLNGDGERELGYVYGREFWGRGIATDALRQFVAEVRDRPLHASAVKTNVGSRRVLEKVGFRLVGEHASDDGVEEFDFRLD